jgi:hypothetical protein
MTFTRARIVYAIGATKFALVPGDFAGATINQGIQERITNKLNDLGEIGYGESQPSQKQGGVVLQYGKANKEVMSLLIGNPLETAAITDAYYHTTFKAVANKNAVVAGQHGFEMTADVTTGSASYTDAKGRSQPLTRQPFATFAPATALSYAQGAAGAFKFSTDLIAGGFDVTPFVPYAVADAEQLTRDSYGLLELILQGVIQYRGVRSVYQVRFAETQLNRQDNSAIDPNATPVSINFRDLSPNCVMDLKFLNRSVVC